MKLLKGDRSQCQSCKELFNSTKAYDKHRTGSHSDRRCLSDQEMLAIEMYLGTDGYWRGSRIAIASHSASRQGHQNGSAIPVVRHSEKTPL